MYTFWLFLMNLMHASTSLLLLWWCENHTACSMFIFCRILWMFLSFYHLHLTLFSRVTYTLKKKWPCILLLNCLPINFLIFWLLGTCCDNLQGRDGAYCTERTCLLQGLPMVCLVFQDQWFSLWTKSAEIQDIQDSLDGILKIIFIQELDLCPSNLVFFSIPIWLPCSYPSASVYSSSGIKCVYFSLLYHLSLPGHLWMSGMVSSLV